MARHHPLAVPSSALLVHGNPRHRMSTSGQTIILACWPSALSSRVTICFASEMIILVSFPKLVHLPVVHVLSRHFAAVDADIQRQPTLRLLTVFQFY